jgi:ribosomal protein L37AE/L43A
MTPADIGKKLIEKPQRRSAWSGSQDGDSISGDGGIMTCRTCRHWAASSAAQLRSRLKEMREQQKSAHRCPDCGGDDWATTNHFVRETKTLSSMWRSVQHFFAR